MLIEKYREPINCLAPLVIDGSVDLADVSTAELMLLVLELYERGEREAAAEACRELAARIDQPATRDDWPGDLLQALDDEARVAG